MLNNNEQDTKYISNIKVVYSNTIFKPALAGQASASDTSVCLFMYLSLSNTWAIGDLNCNPTGTLICLIYRHCCTTQKIVIDEKYIGDENEENFDNFDKPPVDDV